MKQKQYGDVHSQVNHNLELKLTLAMRQTNKQSSTFEMTETRRHYGTSSYEYQQQNRVQVAQRNFLSHSEFPDVKSAVSIKNPNDNSASKYGKMQQQSTKKVAKFKPFNPNIAPANFRKCSINSQIIQNQNYQQQQLKQDQQQQQQQKQHQQQFNQNIIGGQVFYSGQGQAMYQYIPPPEFSQHRMNVYPQNLVQSGPSAKAVAPNGEKIFIPLDNSKYEIKKSDHDLYDMPEDCNLHVLSSDGQFESSVQLHSPRPICVRGSLSDEWSCSSQDEQSTDTDSERETDPDTGTDTSEIATHFVADVLKTITESIDNVSLQGNEDDIKETEKTVSTEHTGNYVLSRKVSDKRESGEKNLNTEPCEKISQGNMNNTDFQKFVSSSSESDIAKTSKRAKTEIKSKYFYATEHNIDLFNTDAKSNKKQKNTKHRAWKENRKQRDKNLKHGKKERKAALASECSTNIKEMQLETTASLDTRAMNYGATEHMDNSAHSMVEENVIIDGQYYVQSQQYYNGQYQDYYIPDTVHPDGYQQYVYSDKPEYTMFIHDACPPPSKEEVCEEVYKSLSGEVINNQLMYQQQAIDSRLCQRPNMEQLVQTPCNNYTGDNTEQIHCNTQGVADIDQGTIHGTANGYSYNMWMGDQAQSTTYSSTSYKVENSNDQQSTSQGQIYISYDEDSVYVDPDSGLSFPALHVTDDLLVTVILREGVFLEITASKVLRLVNHEKKLVVAINETGNKACVIHPAARIYQSDTNVHAELFLDRRAKLTEELIMFGNKLKTYKFDHRMITEMTEKPVFRDMSHDDSVSFLSTDCANGSDEMKLKMEEILAHAHFWKNGTCGSTTIINGTKIVQNENGDVSVYCGPINFLRMNPKKMILRLKTRCIEVDIETNWNVKITRGPHALNASNIGFILCNGKIKASLDSNNNLHSFSMPDHRVLMLGQPVSKHRPGVPVHRSRTQNTEPEGDHCSYTRRNAHDKQRSFREWEEGWDYDNFNNKNCQKRWDPLAGRWVYPTRQCHWQ